MAKLSHLLLSGFLVFIFGAAGVVKLTDRVSPEIHEHMQKEFIEYAKVNPLTLLFKYKVDPNLYLRVIGTMEAVGACLLCLGPRPLKVLASVLLAGIMAGAIQTLYCLKAPAAMFLPALVCLVLLLFNMKLLRQEPVHAKSD